MIKIRKEAHDGIEDAALWYNSQLKGLGSLFIDEIQLVLDRIAQSPKAYPVVHKQTRRILINKFPFGIFYLPLHSQWVVIAVMHVRQDPGQWQKRRHRLST